MNGMQPLKCDFCCGRLIMDDSREFATCEMCGTKYMKSTIQQKIQEIRGNVSVQGDVSVKQSDFTIRGGVLEKYNGASTDVVIPNGVTHIGKEAFKDCKGIKRIVIPNSVVEIGEGAFSGCISLISANIPNGVTNIGYHAFEHCTSLTSVIIPDSVTNIGSYAFCGCKSLSNVSLPKNLKTIDSDTFKYCERLSSVSLPSGLEEIEFYAFCGCPSLTSITIPQSIRAIRTGAFYDCTNLSNVDFPNKTIAFGLPEYDDEGGGYHGAYINIFSPVNWGILNAVNEVFKGSRFASIYLNALNAFENTNIQNGRCKHCGGDFRGIINRVCSKCGKPKDY